MSKFKKDPNNEPVVVYSSDGSGKNIANNSKKKETFEEVKPQSVCIKKLLTAYPVNDILTISPGQNFSLSTP